MCEADPGPGSPGPVGHGPGSRDENVPHSTGSEEAQDRASAPQCQAGQGKAGSTGSIADGNQKQLHMVTWSLQHPHDRSLGPALWGRANGAPAWVQPAAPAHNDPGPGGHAGPCRKPPRCAVRGGPGAHASGGSPETGRPAVYEMCQAGRAPSLPEPCPGGGRAQHRDSRCRHTLSGCLLAVGSPAPRRQAGPVLPALCAHSPSLRPLRPAHLAPQGVRSARVAPALGAPGAGSRLHRHFTAPPLTREGREGQLPEPRARGQQSPQDDGPEGLPGHARPGRGPWARQNPPSRWAEVWGQRVSQGPTTPPNPNQLREQRARDETPSPGPLPLDTHGTLATQATPEGAPDRGADTEPQAAPSAPVQLQQVGDRLRDRVPDPESTGSGSHRRLSEPSTCRQAGAPVLVT